METIVSTFPSHPRGAIRATLERWGATCSLGALAASLLLAAVPHARADTTTTVVAWGLNELTGGWPTTVPDGLSGVIAISAGYYHSLALKDDGKVVAWGGWFSNNYGQGIVPEGLSGVTAIAAGDFHSLALKDNGTVVAWGLDGNGQSTVPAGLTNVTAIAAGDYHSLALKDDGTVVAWGRDDDGQSTVPAGLTDVTAIAAGSSLSVALKGDGTVVAWGINNRISTISPPAGLNEVIAIATGAYHTLALKRDGTVVAWGWQNDRLSSSIVWATVPEGLTNVTAIAAGSRGSLALKSDGTVLAWGDNYYGQTTLPAGLTNVTGIAAGEFHNLAIVTVTVTVPPVSPQQGIANLQADIQMLVDAAVLTSRQANGLIKPLGNALRSLDRGKDADACNQLLDFITKVRKTPALDAATAADLIAAAEAIASIACE
jgi:Regulator of Chromosome Condensation (RCC1) repeat protein/FIMAH domain-containing protein